MFFLIKIYGKSKSMSLKIIDLYENQIRIGLPKISFIPYNVRISPLLFASRTKF